MLEYFTALVLSYTIDSHTVNTTVWFKSEKHCHQAMQLNIAQPLYDNLYDLYGNDIMMHCVVSDKISKKAIRPKLRPTE